MNRKNGSDSSSCGNSSMPCQTLQMGVKQVKKPGKIYIAGAHYLTTGIKIFKSLSVVGNDGATISRMRVARLRHVFKISNRANVSFEHLRILRVGLVDIESSASVVISRCMFEGRTRDTRVYDPITRAFARLVTAYIEATSNSPTNITLNIKNSKFMRTFDPIRIKSSKKRSNLKTTFKIMNTLFFRTDLMSIQGVRRGMIQDTIFKSDKGLQFVYITTGSVCIQRCRFIFGNRKGLELSAQDVMGQYHHPGVSINISDCVFMSFDANSARLEIERFHNVHIKNCMFSKLTTKYDSPVYIKLSKNIYITNTTCYLNTIKDHDGACFTFIDTEMVYLEKSRFKKNEAVRKNGVIHFGRRLRRDKPATVTITDCLFVDNWVKNGASLYITDENVLINASKFVRNQAFGNGGAIAKISVQKSFLIIIGTIFALQVVKAVRYLSKEKLTSSCESLYWLIIMQIFRLAVYIWSQK